MAAYFLLCECPFGHADLIFFLNFHLSLCISATINPIQARTWQYKTKNPKKTKANKKKKSKQKTKQANKT